VEEFALNDLVWINTMDMLEFMDVCGEIAEPITQKLYELGTLALSKKDGGLTFNWI